MAVVPRRRKSGVVYYVANTWHGKPAWERVGKSKREAEQRDNAMKREIAAGTYAPPTTSKALTVKQYAEQWLNRRTNVSAKEERRAIRLYVYAYSWLTEMRLDQVRHVDIDRWVDQLKAEKKKVKRDGVELEVRRLSDKSIANAFGVLKQIFGSAYRADLVMKDPCTLEPGKLKRSPATEREIYTAAELLVLTRHHAIPWPVRMLNALLLFTGMREGEACGRRWRDLDTSCGPLPSLLIHSQYNGRALKTDRPRTAPVHPELGAALAAWAETGFELWTGRKPTADDFIVPNLNRLGQVVGFTRSAFYNLFIRNAEAAGVRPRTVHATRHTFITLCRRGGARPDVLERVTHNAKGAMIDRYTHMQWAPLCEAVLCLALDPHQDQHLPSGNGGNSWGNVLPGSGDQGAEITVKARSGAGLHAWVSGDGSAGNKALQKTRQDSRQLIDDDLRSAIRGRKRKLAALQIVAGEAATPGFGIVAAYEATLNRDAKGVIKGLTKAVRSLGLGKKESHQKKAPGGQL